MNKINIESRNSTGINLKKLSIKINDYLFAAHSFLTNEERQQMASNPQFSIIKD